VLAGLKAISGKRLFVKSLFLTINRQKN